MSLSQQSNVLPIALLSLRADGSLLRANNAAVEWLDLEQAPSWDSAVQLHPIDEHGQPTGEVVEKDVLLQPTDTGGRDLLLRRRGDGVTRAVQWVVAHESNGDITIGIVDVDRRSRIDRALRQQLRSLTARASRAESLANLQWSISRRTDLVSALDQLSALIVQDLPCDGVVVLLRDNQDDALEPVSTASWTLDRSQIAASIDSCAEATTWVAKEHRHLAIPSFDNDPFSGVHPPGVQSYVATPMMDGVQCHGVLLVLFASEHHEQQDELDFLKAAAARGANAISRRRIVEALTAANNTLEQQAVELQQHRESLEELVAERTESLRQTLEQLRVSDRLASIGTLAAGLGHDMNNVLFPMRCRLDSLDRSSVNEQTSDVLDAMDHTIGFLQQLTDGLRLFARDPERSGVVAETHATSWWNDAERFLRRVVVDGVTLDVELEDSLPTLAVSPHQLTQAVLNLFVNACEAMPRGGTLTLTVEQSDDGVAVRVRDTGEGMSEDVLRRLFDPFYTTKTRGMSTGLGMSLVHNVVDGAGGRIDVQSAPGEGTCISMWFGCRRRPDGAPVFADVRVSTPHTRAVVHELLDDTDVRTAASHDANTADIIVAEQGQATDPQAVCIVIGGTSDETDQSSIAVAAPPKLDELRAAIQQAVDRVRAARKESADGADEDSVC